MEWKQTGGNPGGYLQVSDWATGDWHWVVAPVSWAGDWRDLISSTIGFDVKTDYPDDASFIEISCTQTKRLILTADPFVMPLGGSSNMTVGLSESAAQAVVVSLNPAPQLYHRARFRHRGAGPDQRGFPCAGRGGAAPGCEAVIKPRMRSMAPHVSRCAWQAPRQRPLLRIADAHRDRYPWGLRRVDRGGNHRPHAGLSSAHDLHQPARCAYPRQ